MKPVLRFVAAVFAVAASGAILQGIAALAHVPRAQQVVVLPRVEIVAKAPRLPPTGIPPEFGAGSPEGHS